jgi:glycogen debranching enzyme
MSHYYDTHIPNLFALQNEFKGAYMEQTTPPSFADSRKQLPQPFWFGHASATNCYWKVWEIAFKNICQPTPENGFVSNYIDTAFNGNLFMWDSAFILMFTRYGIRAFDFQRTLDNLYCKQHADGFICREIRESDGSDQFERFDPASTGPNVMPWTEWEYYQTTGNRERLAKVFPVLAAYHQWLRAYHTWQDGSYWTSGWGCGMDNQPRIPLMHGYQQNRVSWWGNGRMTWSDACMQQVLSARLLVTMAEVLGRPNEVDDFRNEIKALSEYVNSKLWDAKSAYYYDRHMDGTLTDVKTIGAYWALIAGLVPTDRLQGFIAHLENPLEFKRPHRIPTLSADHPDYSAQGDYWLGSVWPPTNYTVLRGLTEVGHDALAHEIALNHLANVVRVFEQTGTVWENMAPESAAPGNIAARDFVGWGGLPPIAVMFEYVFGIRPDTANGLLRWDIRLMDEHGVKQYPYGNTGVLDLHCEARASTTDTPLISVTSSIKVKLLVTWESGQRVIELQPGITVQTGE